MVKKQIKTKRDAIAELALVQSDIFPRRISDTTINMATEALMLESPCDLCRFNGVQYILCADCPAERRDE